MITGNINDITNLKFYSDRGIELPMQKSYILTWKLIPGNLAKQYMQESPQGYFIGDVDLTDATNIKIASNSLIASFIEKGQIFVRYAEIEATDKNGFKIFSYHTKYNAKDYYDYITKVISDKDNKVTISINIQDNEYTTTYNINDVFKFNGTPENYNTYYVETKIYNGDNTGIIVDGEIKTTNNEYYSLLGLTNIDLVKMAGSEQSFIQTVFERNVPNIGLYFPFIRYSGDFYQDKISTNFIAANTLIVLEECIDPSTDIVTYERPYINADNEYSLLFQPQAKGELRIISDDSEYNVIYKDYASFSLAEKDESEYITPMTFAIGVNADTEGAFQNFLGIYMRSNNDLTKVFFMGAITIKTEVEGEDERFRTLLGNFGIPDPVKYSNIFAEQDYQEEGKDFKLINKKSKELMLTYDQIFSYVGTYKALINAVRFLGYQDIIFKEWYTLLDANDHETDIAVQIFDTSTGSLLKSKLAEYGVSIEDFRKYNKINKISMIYHLNEQDDEHHEDILQHLCYYDASTKKIVVEGEFTKRYDVPLTKPIYEYRSAEILAKLYAVKEWLEYNIIGVGAYISDITGEGLYFGWQKTQGYTTHHDLADYSNEQYYTPNVKCVLPFINSTGKVVCTMNELNNAVRFEDYEHMPISAFIKYEIPIYMSSSDGTELDTSTIIVSNTIETPVLGDEFEFDLVNRPATGTLHEWMADSSTNNEIYINDGEITLLFDKINAAEIDSDCLPIITLENANIHNVFGKWRENTEWIVREVVNSETGNTMYKLKNYNKYRNDGYTIYNKQYIILKATSDDAYIKYTDKTKWQLPMFVIHGYSFYNITIDNSTKIEQYVLDSSSNDYILEILKGDILFKDKENVGAQLSFSNDNIDAEQEIKVTYTYHSERKPFTVIDCCTMIDTIDSSIFDYSEDIDKVIDLSTDIKNWYESLATDISTSIKTAYKHVAYEEAKKYINSEQFTAATQEFINKKKECTEKDLLYDDYMKIYKGNYTYNQNIDVSVTRLGNYDIISRAYDRYNNIYTNKSCRQAKVSAAPISIDTYISNKNSNNSSIFYKANKNGELCSNASIRNIILNSEISPIYPKSYKIYDYEYDLNNNSINFDNISYAIDTPKNNDYVLFENFSEICTRAEEFDGKYTKLYMLDENPERHLLYNDDTSINICVYDNIRKKDIAIYGPAKVIKSYKNDNVSKTTQDDSYLIIDTLLDSNQLNLINLGLYSVYIINVTKYAIIPDENYIKFDYENKLTYINLLQTYKIFNINDVVKISYYMDVSTDDTGNGDIINEVAYRVVDIQKSKNLSEIDELQTYIYVLNDIVDITNLINIPIYGSDNKTYTKKSLITAYMSYATHMPVHYLAKVIGDGTEYNYNIDYQGLSILRTRFNYNNAKTFLKDYLDNTFSGFIYDYDIEELTNQYFNVLNTYNTNTELYYYHNFPTTVKQGDYVIFGEHDKNNVFKPGYYIEWCMKTTILEDTDNIDNFSYHSKKTNILRSGNKFLNIQPSYLGSHDIELKCVDIYGNRLINKGEGLLYVNENKDYKGKRSNLLPTISYYCEYGEAPASKEVIVPYVLTKEDLPDMTEYPKLWKGWDHEEGDVIYGDTVIKGKFRPMNYCKINVERDEENSQWKITFSNISDALKEKIANGESISLAVNCLEAQHPRGQRFYRKYKQPKWLISPRRYKSRMFVPDNIKSIPITNLNDTYIFNDSDIMLYNENNILITTMGIEKVNGFKEYKPHKQWVTFEFILQYSDGRKLPIEKSWTLDNMFQIINDYVPKNK